MGIAKRLEQDLVHGIQLGNSDGVQMEQCLIKANSATDLDLTIQNITVEIFVTKPELPLDWC